MIRNWVIGLALAALAASPVLAASGDYWANVAEEICSEISRSEDAAKIGHMDDAKSHALAAYFGIFEEKKMEIAERLNLGTSHTADIEEMFNILRKTPVSAEKLRKALRNDAQALDQAKIGPDGMGGDSCCAAAY